VFKPTATQNLRLTYNRAFSPPANFSFFLDLPQASIPITPTISYGIRALGVPADGFSYARNSAASSGLYMRSPFPVLAPNPTAAPAFLPNARIDAHAGLMYRTLVAGNQTAFVNALLAAGVSPADVATVFGALLGTASPTNAQVGTVLRLFNPSGVGTPAGPFATIMTPAELTDVGRLKASLNNTYELGYKGILGERFRLAVDAWFQERENFITPAINVTPNAFMDPATLGAYIGGILTVQAQQGRVPPAAVGPLATQFTTSLAQVPVGTVVPDQAGVSPDQGLTNRPDLIFTYRNIEETIDLWGSDVAFDVILGQRVTLLGTYSYVSKTEFPEIPSGIAPLRLNAPAHKATLTSRYRDDLRGWSAELRGRYMNTFPVNSAVYVGTVPVNAFLDANITYRLPVVGRGAMISLGATNLLDNGRASFIGVPEVGRMVMTRLQYTFGGQR
jgi:outer membrane receptor for ferrienterochelin and colicins